MSSLLALRHSLLNATSQPAGSRSPCASRAGVRKSVCEIAVHMGVSRCCRMETGMGEEASGFGVVDIIYTS